MIRLVGYLMSLHEGEVLFYQPCPPIQMWEIGEPQPVIPNCRVVSSWAWRLNSNKPSSSYGQTIAQYLAKKRAHRLPAPTWIRFRFTKFIVQMKKNTIADYSSSGHKHVTTRTDSELGLCRPKSEESSRDLLRGFRFGDTVRWPNTGERLLICIIIRTSQNIFDVASKAHRPLHFCILPSR